MGLRSPRPLVINSEGHKKGHFNGAVLFWRGLRQLPLLMIQHTSPLLTSVWESHHLVTLGTSCHGDRVSAMIRHCVWH